MFQNVRQRSRVPINITAMKKHNPNALRLIPAALGLVFVLLANHARAAVTWWDPEGTLRRPARPAYTGQTSSRVRLPFPGTLAGTWETTSWSTANTGAATPVAWIEGYAAGFAIGAGATNSGNAASTTAFTITMNPKPHRGGHVQRNPKPRTPVIVTINGAGTIPGG